MALFNISFDRFNQKVLGLTRLMLVVLPLHIMLLVATLLYFQPPNFLKTYLDFAATVPSGQLQMDAKPFSPYKAHDMVVRANMDEGRFAFHSQFDIPEPWWTQAHAAPQASDSIVFDKSQRCLALYISSLPLGHSKLWINDVLVFDSVEQNANWYEPLSSGRVLILPLESLKSTGNTVRWEGLTYGTRFSLPSLKIAYLSHLELLQTFNWVVHLFLSFLVLLAGFIVSIVMATLYKKSDRNPIYLAWGATQIGQSLTIYCLMLMPQTPIWMLQWWQIIVYLPASAIYSLGITSFLLVRQNLPAAKLLKLLSIYCGVGFALIVLNYLVANQSYSYIEPVWHTGLLILSAYVMVLCVRSAKPLTANDGLLLGGMLLTICFILSDTLIYHGLHPYPEISTWMQVPCFLWYYILFYVYIYDYSVAQKQLTRNKTMLESRLQQQRILLQNQFSQLAQIQRQKTLQHERQRMMQELHDGLGSQLLSSLLLAENKTSSREDLTQALRDSIDDLRLAIDVYSESDKTPELALNNLGFRLASRLSAAGIELNWLGQDALENLSLAPSSTLCVLRFVQEATSNAVRHAQGVSKISITFMQEEETFFCSVENDGAGFDVDTVRRGKGLNGMQKRAQSARGEVEIISGKKGSCLTLILPVK